MAENFVLEIRQKLEIQSIHYLDVLKIIKAKGNQVRLVGGVVRDAILGRVSNDIDIATDMLPDQVTETFTSLGYKVLPTGIRFGTVLVLYKGESFEITTLRKDISSDGRRAKVEYTDDFRLDAQRRDFTINALSYCPFKETIYDYFHGFADLLAGKVRFIGEPASRIKEDYLRILRFFRFFGRFGRELDQESYQSCIKYKAFLQNLSRERIKAELDLILKLPGYINILALLYNSSILPEILPIDYFAQENLVAAERLAVKLNVPLTPEFKYALLFIKASISVDTLIALKFSRLEARKISSFIDLTKYKDNNDDYFLKELWVKNMAQNNDQNKNFALLCIFLTVITGKTEYTELPGLLRMLPEPHFPLNGHDMVRLGFSRAEVGSMLAHLKKQWIKSDFKLSKADLITIIKKEKDELNK